MLPPGPRRALDVRHLRGSARHEAPVVRAEAYSLRKEDNIYIRALDIQTLDRTFGFGIRLAF